MITPKFPKVQDHMPLGTVFIEPAENAHLGLHVPELIGEYGDMSSQLRNMPQVFPKMLQCMLRMQKSFRSLKRNPAPSPTQADPTFFEDLKAYAFSLGCNAVGFTSIPRDYIFSNKRILFDRAIVITMKMEKTRIGQAPSMEAGKEVWRSYAALGKIVNQLAYFLRAHGHNAHAGPALGGDVNYPRLAQKAGLGHIGRHGLLISPGSGPSQRIAVVYTNIENLPFTDSHAYDWIPAFCDTCNHCVKTCPAQAIYTTPKIFPDDSEEHIDYTKCAVPFSHTMGCSVCIKECTFFKGDFDKIERRFKEKK